MKKVKLIPPPYQYDKIKTDYGDSGLKFDLEQKSKSGKSMFGYLIVAIIGALFCLLTLNALGWQKPGKAQQIKPTRQKVEAPNMLIKRNVPPGATIFVMSDSTLYMSTEYGRYILELQNESSALIKVYK